MREEKGRGEEREETISADGRGLSLLLCDYTDNN